MWSKVFVCASLHKSTPIPAELMNADNVEMQLHLPMTPDSEVNERDGQCCAQEVQREQQTETS